jgi:hypothetical protein
LVGNYSTLTFALPIKKRAFHRKRIIKKKKNLADEMKALTFALPIKKMGFFQRKK